MKTINKEYLKSLNPSMDRWRNYLKHCSDFNGTIVEFLELKSISWSDKKWVVFNSDKPVFSDELMREFALICACRAVDRYDSQEVKDYYDIVLNIYMSGWTDLKNSAAYSAAYWAAYWAAYSAAYRAASSAEEEEVQKQILINLIEEYEPSN